MPDKHSNNKSIVSEELIRKYLAGELDDKAMHALERQALDDPFLAEALEGYAGHTPDQSAQLANLQNRLEQRVGQSARSRTRLLYYRWASAAAILVILGLSFLWIDRQQANQEKKEIAKAEPPAAYKAADSTTGTPAPAAPATEPAPETLLAKTNKLPAARQEAPVLSKAAKATARASETILPEDKAATPASGETAPQANVKADAPEKETAYDIASNNVAAQRQQTMAARNRAPEARRMEKAAFAPRARRIVILGSSTAEGVGPKSADSAWVSLLRKYLQEKDPAATVTNLALGGSTSYRILPDTADRSSFRPGPDKEHNINKALGYHPDMIIINMPSNDIAAGYSVEEFRRNLARVVNIIRQQHIRFYITTTQPRNTGPASHRKKLEQMRDLIIRDYPEAYINCWEGISSADGNILPKYDSGDGVHLNGLGHRIMFERVKEKID